MNPTIIKIGPDRMDGPEKTGIGPIYGLVCLDDRICN